MPTRVRHGPAELLRAIRDGSRRSHDTDPLPPWKAAEEAEQKERIVWLVGPPGRGAESYLTRSRILSAFALIRTSFSFYSTLLSW